MIYNFFSANSLCILCRYIINVISLRSMDMTQSLKNISPFISHTCLLYSAIELENLINPYYWTWKQNLCNDGVILQFFLSTSILRSHIQLFMYFLSVMMVSHFLLDNHRWFKKYFEFDSWIEAVMKGIRLHIYQAVDDVDANKKWEIMV